MRIEYSQDVDDIRPLAEKWAAQCHAEKFGLQLNLEVTLAELAQSLESLNGVLIIAKEEEQPVGFFAVVSVPSFLGNENVALEKYWYAEPNHALVGPKLYVMARRWALAAGCHHFLIAASRLASDEHDKVVQFCTAMGLRPFETTFIENLGE